MSVHHDSQPLASSSKITPNIAISDPSSSKSADSGAQDGSGDAKSDWHTIRPWTPRLALAVREITSVSATFVLADSLAVPDELAEGFEGDEEGDGGGEDQGQGQGDGNAEGDGGERGEEKAKEREGRSRRRGMSTSSWSSTKDGGDGADGDGGGNVSTTGADNANANTNASSEERSLESSRPTIADALAPGLSLTVNGSPWARVILRVDEPGDRAVIVIYGLMPGRQYDIDLGLQTAWGNVRGRITTDADATDDSAPSDMSGPTINGTTAGASLQPSITASSSLLPSPTTPISSIGAQPSSPPSPSSSPGPNNAQLAAHQAQLTPLLSTHTQLSQALKSARRDAQRADAAARGEADALRRAAERAAAADVRARGRILGLGEAVRRAEAATAQMREETRDIEGELPGLEATVHAREDDVARVRRDADEARRQREEQEEEGRRRLERGRAEVNACGHRLERLKARTEKLEGGMPELEKQLQEVEEEIKRAEEEAVANSEQAQAQAAAAAAAATTSASSSTSPHRRRSYGPHPSIPSHHLAPPHLAHASHLQGSLQTQQQQQQQHPAPIARPSIMLSASSTQPALAPPSVIQRPRGAIPSSTSLGGNSGSSAVGTLSLVPGTLGAERMSSTLSSRAPVFEPSQARWGAMLSGTPTGSANPATGGAGVLGPTAIQPIQRPARTGNVGVHR
ncbi:hypothetical protein CONPUDRAFT_168227 [Coniophora puteana RWD-64-598 SS2]|uniref:Uncharacterized protein n=1 Tax=Coniophora puteana (strain RWD-64-598) TaxID=741705 RepID=A0A5M3MDD8_CONPW|nr:uncharacterized protein CONPUDRAFT_168227 [Coniophora puteana RWD-64-598 SS2]EIW77238.1 hypothetical protein CONPUDRAFT_168227 [Coniophora puteana RWD-64-598 SS2]